MWYTHLGYERTLLSARKSLATLRGCDWAKHEMVYSGGLAGPKGAAEGTLESAQLQCLQLGGALCKAVTCETERHDRCTARASAALTASPHGSEVTYVPSANCFTDLSWSRDVLPDGTAYWWKTGPDGSPVTRFDNPVPASEVTLLLHWPRCSSNIEWMRCEEEEEALPQAVKDAGAPPHLDPMSWHESWRALEVLYKAGAVKNIGVSNFNADEMQDLLQRATVKPHVVQGSVWSALFDPTLMDMLKRHSIHFQAYAVMSTIVAHETWEPAAWKTLVTICLDLYKMVGRQSGRRIELDLNPAQLVLAWLVDQGVSVIPRASARTHMRQNSPNSVRVTLDALRRYQGPQGQRVRQQLRGAIQALARAQRPKHETRPAEDARVRTIFVNHLEVPIEIFFVNAKTNKEVKVSGVIQPSQQIGIDSHPGHRFLARPVQGSAQHILPYEFVVTAKYGAAETFRVLGRDEL